eukprot:CAMPEP_0117688934 /NCGR_PEP_ID=MMETSP0804-20121206/24156_1 /TAXON_ID=1074897 /ORGANISM="Tetraselmis astigmatica, Strain CCMP880" /LENGTH=500 /DNA_ID=CAMNT_0005501543 /DNA_START=150 /DNA_END=1652 /DNA_ORIENTATION=-
MSGHPQPYPGTCPNGSPTDICALIVNTTLYDPLIVDLGPAWEQYFSRGTQWFTFILSVIMSIWFVYNMYTGHCGWEVIFVTVIEFTKIVVEIFWEYETPNMIYSVFGPVTSWLRYIEWLLTCPVILIHLSNLTGLDEEYSARTMELLTSDQGTICFGITAALAGPGWIKVITFVVGLSFGINTFYTASRVYIEAYHQVPKGLCRTLVKYLCGMFFCSWLMFPLLFLAGPEGFGYLTWSGSTIGHTVADLLSKNIWGLIAHYMQVKIREHILIHGDIRKTVEKTVAGHTFEVEEFATKDDEDAEEVEDSPLDRRASFQLIGKKLERHGQDVALGKERDEEDGTMKGNMNPMSPTSPTLGAGGMQMDQNQMMQMMQQMMAQNPQMMSMMGRQPLQQMQPQQQQMQPQQQMQMQPQQSQQMMHQQSMNGMPQQQMQMPPLMSQNSMPQHQMMMNQPSMSHQMSGQMSPGAMSPGQLSPGQMSPGGPMYSGGGQQGMMGFPNQM